MREALFAVGRIQRFKHFVSDVVLRVDVDRFLNNQVVFFSFGNRLDNPVGTLYDLLQFFVFAGVQVFLEFPALALEIAILINQLLLARSALAFCQSRRFAFKLVRSRFQLRGDIVEFFFTLAELLFKLGLRRFCGIRLTENPVQIDDSHLEFLGASVKAKHGDHGTQKQFA